MTEPRAALLAAFDKTTGSGALPTADTLAALEREVIALGFSGGTILGWRQGIERAAEVATRLARENASTEAFKTEITKALLNGGFTYTEASHVGGAIYGLAVGAARAEARAREKVRLDAEVAAATAQIAAAFPKAPTP